MIYDYIITKPPLNEDTLAHYGVKGMKWKKRKAKKKSQKQKDDYVASHIADDIVSGKRSRKKDTNDRRIDTSVKNTRYQEHVSSNNGKYSTYTTNNGKEYIQRSTNVHSYLEQIDKAKQRRAKNRR